MNYAWQRARLLDWLRAQLMGPAFRENSLKGISPLDRYHTGILFPIVLGEEGIDPASVDEDEGENPDSPGAEDGAQETAEPAVKRRRYVPPSSVGFSFFARGENLRFEVLCSAARYTRGDGERDAKSGQFVGRQYERHVLGGDAEAVSFTGTRRVDIWPKDGVPLAGLDVLMRPYADGWIVTVSLFNRQEWQVEDDPKQISQDRIEKSLFEVELRCALESGEIGLYPKVDHSLLSKEEQELELQYRSRRIYAVGHGAAVDWRLEDDVVREIRSEFLPAVEVPQVTADVADPESPELGLAYLAAHPDPVEFCEQLARFVAGYGRWVADQSAQVENFSSQERATAGRILARMDTALNRMRCGVALLRAEPQAFMAFQIANQAMLDQMRQTDRLRGTVREDEAYRWRPFQLAFLLTGIESTICEGDEFRDVVDLIWFPTGGGKTEAYLGLVAFLIAWRRMAYPTSGGGTTVLMRYTLRLLTAQQYQRATRMICALELIRRANPALGDEPISIGMWVGSATSPNLCVEAQKLVLQASEGKTAALRGLVLESCPWCGTPFRAPMNYVATLTEFRFRCLHPGCAFAEHGGGFLPCNVVDEALYQTPPTLLVATIDKFARLAWEEQASAFFGGVERSRRPPELVIQDELHLIAGALGSVAGLYEAALDTVLIQRGVYPKYIASTATIRMAAQQVKRLYGRKLAVFPPPGLSCDDAYFARTVPLAERPGRLYVGYLAPLLDRQHNMAPLAAALLVGPEAVFGPGERDRDDLLEAWWTQVVYHGSLRGVGNSHNAFNIDVRDFAARLLAEIEQAARDAGSSAGPALRPTARLAQLTSLCSPEENARTFARLERHRADPECLDAVLATNMISVGLDVARLAAMIINGQPMTTAEYIQASSRVGRGAVPGLVFANYYRDQARSLSHYENFRPYHEAFYRYVEPTSVTPYTYQARSRALHAALVIALRHAGTRWLGNQEAGRFDPACAEAAKIIERLKHRCAQADRQRAGETAAHIDRLVGEWRAEVLYCQEERRQLHYQAPDNDKSAQRLLYNHEDRIKGLWPTLQSMRHVENTGILKPL
jgi:hypothetical protein